MRRSSVLHALSQRLAVAGLAAILAGCGAGSSPARGSHGPATPPVAAREGQAPGKAVTASGGVEGTRPNDAVAVADFDQLVAMVRRYHVFAPQTEKNLGKKWKDDLPRLRAELLAAKTPEALQVALWHFGNSLHDVHCQYRAKERGDRIKLGFRVGVEKHEGRHRFYVEKVSAKELGQQLSPGDLLESVDGVPADRLIDEHDLVSNMSSRDNIAYDVARWLTSRRTSTTLVRPGAVSKWRVRPRAGGDARTVELTWKKSENDDVDDFALPYDDEDCAWGDAKTYGSYKMAARGYRACIYTSTAPKYRDYPIVRQISFRYDEYPHGPLVDYELIKSTLARTKPKGVILDVQDNGGGMNPNVFLEWWTDKPYTDTVTRMVLDESLLRDAEGGVHISSMNDAIKAWYEGELARRTPGQRISGPRPFMCKPDTCAWSNQYEPRHRVTAAPVALLLGPGCASSCDAVAWHFDKEDIGPIVGRPPMAGFTTHRARFGVVPSPGAPEIGTIDLAIAYDTASGSTESIEAVPVKIDVPVERTFENHAKYDELLVDRAIEALQRR